MYNKIKKIINIVTKVVGLWIFRIFGPDINSGFSVSQNFYKLSHFGTKYGGWTIPSKILSDTSVCYLVGAGEDISFDIEITKKYKPNVFIFDPTPRAITHFELLKHTIENNGKMPINNSLDDFYSLDKESLKKIKYLPIGIWKKNGMQRFYAPRKKAYVSHSITHQGTREKYFDAECRTISSLMKQFDHKQLDLLKIDVEGAEWDIIDSILKDKVAIKILCVEFDETDTESFSGKIKLNKYIKQLKNAGFEVQHVDGPNYTFFKQ